MALVDGDFNHSEHGLEEGFCTPLRCVVETQEAQIHEVELLSTPIDSVVDDFNHLEEGFCTPLRCVVENEEGHVEDKLNDPEVGMVFSSWEEADKFWRQYGKQRGFGVLRAAGNYKTENGRSDKTKLRSYIWRCECAGQPDIRRKVNGKRVYGGGLSLQLNRRKTKKCGCLVQMRAACKQDGSWEVKKAVVVHVNHNPTPRKSRYISMFRQDEINSVVKRKLFNDCSAGSKVTQVHRSLAKERGGVENMAITERDLRNVLAKEKKFKMSGGDTNAMLAYFDRMTADNQNFFHKYRVNDEGRLTDVMWVDARSRVAYEEFGDVVCFDSTYITNEYKLPFSNFVGVNHHGQTILLGCALVSHEDTDTFVWLFNNWKECMSGKVPGGFLTDQCPAMRKALSIVMPGAKHRWCLWHILNKFGTKLGKYSKYEEFHDVLLNVIHDSLTEEEFEVNWTLAMESYGLANDDWLTVLYDERHMWIPAYMKHLFWAGMKTTQRSESINSFFDKYVKSDTRLYEFVERYCDAMENRVNSEKEADANSAMRVRHVLTTFPFEKVFQKFYTDAKFEEIQEQLARLLYVSVVSKTELCGNVVEHSVEDRVWIYLKDQRKEIPIDKKRVYRVHFNIETKEATCECKLFECHRIMCRHQFKVYDVNDITEIPKKYILRRWHKDVQRRHTRVKVAYHDPSKTEEVKRFDSLMVRFERVCLKASAQQKYVEMALEGLSNLEESIDAAIMEATDDANVAMPSEDAMPCDDIMTEGYNNVVGVEDIDLTPHVVPATKSTVLPTHVGDPLSCKKKAHRPRTKRFLACTEKKGKKASTSVQQQTQATASGIPVHCYGLNVDEPMTPIPKPRKKRARKAKANTDVQLVQSVFGNDGPVLSPQNRWVGGIGYGPAYGELCYFTRSYNNCPNWVARDVLPFVSCAGLYTMATTPSN